MKGDGSVYRHGKGWWLAYYVSGKLVREAGGTSKTDAKAKLKEVHKAQREGTYLAPAQRHLTVNTLLDELETHLENKRIKSLSKLRSHLMAIRLAFGGRRALDVTTATLEDYWKDRTAAGKAPATVCRELEGLRRAFNYAADQKPPRFPKHEIPHFELPKVENARQGFLPRGDFEAVLAAVEDPDVRDFIAWSWWTGMRPNETRQLTWPMLSTQEKTWTLDLDPKAAKIGKGRTIAVVGPLRTIIERRLAARRLDTLLIFHRTSKGRVGQPVKDYRLAWAAACKVAGLLAGRKVEGGVTPYDLRRCAVRNLVRGGTHETIAMKITGHKTRSTFDRYNIADVADVAAAMDRTAAYVETLTTERKIAGTIEYSQDMHNRGPRRKAR
jgi:integrase